MPRAKSTDPKRNAGISLSGDEIRKLEDYCKAAKLGSVSAVVSLLIEKGLPFLWWDLELGDRPMTDAERKRKQRRK